VFRLERLGVLPSPRVSRFGIIKGPERLQYVCRLGSGHVLVNVEQQTDFGTHRLSELDRQGRTVWESVYGNTVGGLQICAMVRFGFDRMTEGVEDLDTAESQLRRLQHPAWVVRRQAADWLSAHKATKQSCRGILKVLDDNDLRTRRNAIRVLRNGSHILSKGGAATKEAIPVLIRRLADPEIRVRGATADLLATCGRPAIPAVIAAFEDRTGKQAALRRRWAASAGGGRRPLLGQRGGET